MSLSRTLSTALFVVAFGLPAVAAADDAAATRTKLEAAVTGTHRAEGHAARNEWRHPVETLLFFGLRDDMTVVEIYPGGEGWYTEVLAPVLRERGKLYAASYDAQSPQQYFRDNAKLYLDKLAAHPEVYDKVVVTELAPPEKTAIAPPGSADLVVTFRNLHNWVSRGTEGPMLEAMYRALKPGGTLGMVAHRGTPEMVGAEAAKAGYLAEAEAIRLVEAAGFRLVGKSEINANPKDTKDHPKGVWTLPPNFQLGEQDRAKYAAIGESDRMTLRFEKPR